MLRLLTVLVTLISVGDIPSAFREYRMFLEGYGRQKAGDHAAAGRIYATLLSSPSATLLRRESLFNLACAEYAQNRFMNAAALDANLQGSKGPIGSNAAYNRGNALARAAFAEPRAATYRERLRQALASYRRALVADPAHTDARINYEIVLRALRRISPPPSPSGGGGGGGQVAPGSRQRQQGLSTDVSNLILDNARLQEGEMMRKYFRPAPPRQNAKESRDW